MEIKLKPFQDEFLFSTKKFPCMCAGVGTGKTFMLLLKAWKHCEQYPGSVALVVRKEFTDLHDSTLKDFKRYFNVDIDSNKEYKFPNNSILMFRHGAELNVLKNMSLSFVGIEQAEEFDDEEQFTFLRDRLRHPIGTRQLSMICNASGHNYIWRLWKGNPPSEEYHLITATTFDNADNLPADFVSDLARMEQESPHHYRRYVLNSFEEVGADDMLLTGPVVYNSPKLEFYDQGTIRKILAVDVARFGEDETVFTIIQSQNIREWVQIYQHTWRDKPLTEVVGKVLDLKREFNPDIVAIDDCGMGGGVTDRLSEQRTIPEAFIGNEKSTNILYQDKRSEGFFRMAEFFNKGYIKIMNDPILMEQLLAIRYKFKSDSKKAIVTKDEMRKDGLKSPDRADALMMALYYTDRVFRAEVNPNLPREAVLV